MDQLCKLAYISNAGVLLEYKDRKIMIDSFCDSVLPIFKNPPGELRECMISGKKPFDNIDILLFTHNHTDHFDAADTVSFLKNNKDTLVLGPGDVIMEIKQGFSHIESKRLINLDYSPGKSEYLNVKGIGIQSISMLHEGKEYRNINNLAYLIDMDGEIVLHVGDAKPVQENYIHMDLVHKSIDLLIAPFSYISLPIGRQVVEKYIKPRKIAALHFPYKELDSYGWIDITKRVYMRIKDDFIETVFLEDIGDFMYV